MRKSIIISAIILFNMTPLFIQKVSADNKFETLAEHAHNAYVEGQYHLAIELYDSIVNAGYQSGALFYNIGNAHFKNNQMAHAIWYYEKAKKLNPSDPHIRFNLELANSLITDRIEILPLLFYQRWWQALYNMLSADKWATVLVVILSLFFIFFAFYLLAKTIFLKKSFFGLTILSLVIFVLSFILSLKQYRLQVKEETAIVFSPRVTVKSAPDENSIDLFVIHDGTKVYITDIVGDWYEIKIASGNLGWIKKTNVRQI